MFLTKEKLKRIKACKTGMEWFERSFPKGAEIIDIINSPETNFDFLHWGFENLETTEEEKEAYLNRLNIVGCNKETIKKSNNISDSYVVAYSKNVDKSEYVYNSGNIEKSKRIINCIGVKNGQNVFESRDVNNSINVYSSTHISNSDNIIGSNYVANSHSVYNVDNVSNSFVIFDLTTGESSDIENCAFLTDCALLANCAFCSGLSGEEYHVFNKPITKQQFDIIMKQLSSILKQYRANYVDWNEEVIESSPSLFPNGEHHIYLPKEFWEWVKNVPGYDPRILYQITANHELLNEF